MHDLALLRDHADHPGPDLYASADRLILIAPAGNDFQRPVVGLEKENAGVVELEELVHRPQRRVAYFVEVQGGVDVSGHALQDPDLGHLPGKVLDVFARILIHCLRDACTPSEMTRGRVELQPLDEASMSDEPVVPRGLHPFDREHPVDVGCTELENTGHAGHRGDGLDLHIHGIENRTFGFRPLKFELQFPMCTPRNIEDAHEGTGVLTDIADRLGEELERERRVRLVHIVDL